MASIRQTWARWRAGVLLVACLAMGAAALAAEPLRLSAQPGTHDTWPATRVLFEEPGAGELAPGQAQRMLAQAPAPAALRANLGQRTTGAWLGLAVQRAPGAPAQWVLALDYASLDRVDVYLAEAGQPPRHLGRMGDHVPWALRPMAGRVHVMMLELPDTAPRELLLRVQTTGSMVVPLTLSTPQRYAQAEAAEQALQGLVAGMGLCLLLYSLAQWAVLRDAMFGLYALTLAGSVGFFAALSGMGPLYLWSGSDWLTRNAPPLFILLGVSGAFFFVQRALDVPRHSPRVAGLVRACGTLAGAAAAALALGWIDYATAQKVGLALGPTPLLLVLPTAYRRLRAGDAAARWVLMGWGAYSLGVLAIVGMLAGWLPVGFWTLHGFQFASMLEMAMWMLVLGQRVQDIRADAARVRRDRDRLHGLAHADVLTGLLNRRGLQEAAAPLLAAAGPRQALALYLLDLDGFKPVNDRLGHDAGDELLRGVAGRLRQAVRGTDLVCRLGGDEFVVLAPGLPDDAAALQLGHKLLASVRQPFTVAGTPCQVGMTVGYALAPHDEADLAGLLRRADAAMYGGKQAGRNRVGRSPASPGVAAATAA